jgi:hypothetical protein
LIEILVEEESRVVRVVNNEIKTGVISKQFNFVVNSHKHLGVIISENGQWNDHIDYIVKKNL